MADISLAQVIKDQNFLQLSPEEKITVLRRVGGQDRGFIGLPSDEQEKVITRLSQLTVTGKPEPSLFTPSEAQQALRSTLKGTMIGVPAAIGAAMATPSLPALGPFAPAAGAAIGSATGTAAWHATEPHLPEAVFGPPPASQTTPERLREIAEQAAYGATFEMGGPLVAKGAEKVLPWFLVPRAGKVTPQGKTLLEIGKEAGFQPSVSDVAPGNIVSPASAWARRQFGGGRLTKQAQEEVKVMKGSPVTGEQGWIETAGEKVSPKSASTSVARGETIRQGLKTIADENRGAWRDYVWDEVRGFDDGTAVMPSQPIEEVASEMLRKPAIRQGIIDEATSARLRPEGGKWIPGAAKPQVRTKRAGQEEWPEPPEGTEYNRTVYTFDPNEPVPPGTPPPGGVFLTQKVIQGGEADQSFLEALANRKGKPYTFEQMRVIREWVGQQYNKDPKTWGRLFGATKDATAQGLRDIPGASEAYQRALQYETANILPFKSSEPEGFLGKLIDQQEPVKLLDHLFTPKDKAIAEWMAIRTQTNGTGPVWEALQGEAIARAIDNPRFLKTLGEETRKILLSPEQVGFLRKLDIYRTTSTAAGKTLADFERPPGVLTALANQVGRVASLTLRIAPAAVGAYSGFPITGLVGTTALTLTPNIVARMLTNPTTARWMMKGLTTPQASPEAMRIAAQLLPRYYQAVSEEYKPHIPTEVMRGVRAQQSPQNSLRRSDDEYKNFRRLGITDADIQQRFGVTLTD